MSDLTDANVSNILKAVFSAEVALPANLYIGLKVGGSEVAGDGYARQAVVRNATNFVVDQANRKVTLATEVTGWTASGGDWGSVASAALFTAATGGSEIVSSDLQTPRDVLDGESFSIPANVWAVSMPESV
jgi:hypothetical protein